MLENRSAITRQNLADEYDVDRKTMYRWLKKIEEKVGIEIPPGKIFPKYERLIRAELG